MKRLKYLHPFGGKPFAGLLIMYSAIFGAGIGFFLSIHFLEMRYLLWCTLLPPVIAVLILLPVCNIRRQWDRDAIAASRKAEWKPITEERLNLLRMMLDDSAERRIQKKKALRSLIVFIIFAGFFFLDIVTSRNDWRDFPEVVRNEILTPPVRIAVFILGGILLLHGIYRITRRQVWLRVNESAVCADIPVDSIYEVTRYVQRGVKETVRYLVFYQPDGKYIVPAPVGSTENGFVTVIRFRGFARCAAFLGVI